MLWLLLLLVVVVVVVVVAVVVVVVAVVVVVGGLSHPDKEASDLSRLLRCCRCQAWYRSYYGGLHFMGETLTRRFAENLPRLGLSSCSMQIARQQRIFCQMI